MPNSLQPLVLDQICVKESPEPHWGIQTEILSYLYWAVLTRNGEHDNIQIQNSLWQSSPDYETIQQSYLQPNTNDTKLVWLRKTQSSVVTVGEDGYSLWYCCMVQPPPQVNPLQWDGTQGSDHTSA
ncbi:hypothetical protein BS47DRAFT_1360036 [Hydnum rufescens UP504]|uniref:Uncharacterized protein n=1 Tax=Hydnum rufescens UP504 TaxID=1448309 RepID=A0A9P6B352_9AGAM|nr:hypothetical protein BS47DRAFT_1360036 [Hydnum rufescens UP504]